MPTVYSSANDGFCGQGLNAPYEDARGGAGNLSDNNNTRDSISVWMFGTGRGGGSWGIRRAFLDFDTSGIASTVDAATFILRPYGSYNDADIIIVRSEHSTSLANGDFNSFPAAAVTALGNSDGANGGTFEGISNLTYSAQISTWGTNVNVDNEIALNATALADMESLATFKICIMEHDFDYRDIAPPTSPGTNLEIGFHWQEMGGDYRPHIDYTLATAAVTENATFFGANF